MTQRWKLTIEYDGRAFSGWQRQEPGIVSVQGAIEDALYAFCQQHITIHVAGRTDAGVHATGQVAHFDLDYGDRPLDGHGLIMALNAHLSMKDQLVAILHAEPVSQEFHARFGAVNKLYSYRILNRPARPALDGTRIWHVRRKLDLDAMRAGAAHLLGHHDFTTFRDTDCQAKSPLRTLDRMDILATPADAFGGTHIDIQLEARSFLHHQVRNMVGTLELVGAGKWSPDDVKTALDARNRSAGGPTAPADGLYLVRVDY